ncbi:unnamed protein product [Moneuplotes crassus]|uniref:BPL/LPL catalytic domain-containing protein n=1 Tax=Euplotes crassus TaxID=5936 RepID=A0AAD1XIV6_EUPCR|nr:unnamed protein product [Moneuplotes crassus]
MHRYLIRGNPSVFQAFRGGTQNIAAKEPIQGYERLKEYYETAQDSRFDHLLYSIEEPSTQTYLWDVYHGSEEYPGNIFYVTNNQTAGKGRKNNKWVANDSTLCFSYSYCVHTKSRSSSTEYFKELAFLPYLNGICLVKALPGYRLFLKWPNDLYGVSLKHSELELKDSSKIRKYSKKIGGILCESEEIHGKITAICGIGINWDQAPSDDFMDIQQISEDGSISRGEFLKQFLVNFEKYQPLLKTARGRKEISEIVQHHWMHSDQSVTVNSPDFKNHKFKAKITGISDTGLLEVESMYGSFEVYPDNHSFDLRSNSIIQKK